MSGIADGHFALVLREVVRFAQLARVSIELPSAGSSTFKMTNMGGDTNDGYLNRFESLTGGPHGAWVSPTLSTSRNLSPVATPRLVDCMKKERGIVRFVNAWRWKWHSLLRDEGVMWAGLLNLRIAHERWTDRAKGEFLLVEQSGRTYGAVPRIGEPARAVQEFLRVFASLNAEVVLSNATGVDGRGVERPLTASDEWPRVQTCDVTVKVLGEIPAPPPTALFFPKEALDD